MHEMFIGSFSFLLWAFYVQGFMGTVRFRAFMALDFGVRFLL